MANTPATNPNPAPAAPEPTTSGAIVPTGLPSLVLGNDEFRGSLEPRSLGEAFTLAGMIAATGICGVSTPQDALVRILTGRSLGLSAMQSLRGIYVVEGRPGLDASLMQAICQHSPLCEYFDFVSGDEAQATYKTKRVGREERRFTYTIEDAKRQGLLDKGSTDEKKANNNWNRMPKQMLRARAKSELARLEYPDLMFGMYSREELVDVVGGEEEADRIEARIAEVRRTTPKEVEVEIIEPAVRSAPRDHAAEVAEFQTRIKAAQTKQGLAEVRDAIAKWDGPDDLKKSLNDVYAAHITALQSAREQRKGTAAAPAAVPDGNLFEKSEPKS